MFWFEGLRDLRPLPSFPTRRSSDLVSALCVSACVAMLAWPAFSRAQATTTCPQGQWDMADVVMMDKSLRDRKSTRLNSSHRCRSYAVFCLKKKNIKIVRDMSNDPNV